MPTAKPPKRIMTDHKAGGKAPSLRRLTSIRSHARWPELHCISYLPCTNWIASSLPMDDHGIQTASIAGSDPSWSSDNACLRVTLTQARPRTINRAKRTDGKALFLSQDRQACARRKRNGSDSVTLTLLGSRNRADRRRMPRHHNESES